MQKNMRRLLAATGIGLAIGVGALGIGKDASSQASMAKVATMAPDQANPPYEIITVQKGAFNFEPTQKQLDDGNVDPAQCFAEGAKITCGCDADVQRVQLTGGNPEATAKINAVLAKMTAPSCDIELSQTKGRQIVTAITDKNVEVKVTTAIVMRGAGSELSQEQSISFDRMTGQQTLLKSAASPSP